MKELWIIGIHIPERSEKIEDVQNILTKFGCSIRTRLGLHKPVEGNGTRGGTILLELTGNPAEFRKLERSLKEIPDLEVKKMIFKQG